MSHPKNPWTEDYTSESAIDGTNLEETPVNKSDSIGVDEILDNLNNTKHRVHSYVRFELPSEGLDPERADDFVFDYLDGETDREEAHQVGRFVERYDGELVVDHDAVREGMDEFYESI